MKGTQFASVSGSYSTYFIGSWELNSQNIEKNSSLIRLYGTFRYGGGEKVNSDYSSFKVNGVSVASGSYTYYPGDTQLGYTDISVTHNADGTFPSTEITISASSYHMSGSKTGTISGVAAISRKAEILTAPDFLHTENPTISFKNPGGFPINAGIEYGSDHTLLCRADNIANTGSYTFQLTSEQRDALLSACSNARTLDVRFVIGSIIGGGSTETHWSWLDKKMTVQESSAKPSFTDFDFADINTSVVEVTGNDQILVSGQSTLRVSIPTSKKASSRYGASISKYRLSCGNKTVDASYDNNTVTMNIQEVMSGTVVVTAVDSRGFETSVTKKTTFIPYTKPSILSAYANRENGVGAQTTLSINSKIYTSKNIGATTNRITSIAYQYKNEDSNTWQEGITVIPCATNVSLVIVGDIPEGFTMMKNFLLRITLCDSITSTSLEIRVSSGTPVVDMYRLNHNVGISIGSLYDEEAGGLLQLCGIPVAGFVVEEGTDGDWAFRKWNSGFAECWCTPADISVTSINTVWNSMYYREIYRGLAYPADLFVSRPVCTIGCHSSNFPGWIREVSPTNSITTAPGLWACTPVAYNTTSGMTFYPSYYAIGRWKE